MALTVKKRTASGFTVNLDAIPEENKNYRVKVIAKLQDGTSLEAYKDILVERIPVDVISFDGERVLGEVGAVYNYKIIYSNSGEKEYNVGVRDINVSSDLLATVLKVNKIDRETFSLTMLEMPEEVTTANITVQAILEDGTTANGSMEVSLKVTPSVSIIGEDSFDANNGIGSSRYTFSFFPKQYNVSVALKSVATNSSNVTVFNPSLSGFTLKADTTANVSIMVTAVLTIDGKDMTYTKNVTVMFNDGPLEYEAIDLGLPSGKKWCKSNIGTVSETDDGQYFQWGEIVGHRSGYEFSPSNSTVDITGDLTMANDAARQNMGGTWYTPSNEDFEELRSNTDHEWVEIDGIYGIKFTSRTNGKYVFFPASGQGYYGAIFYVGTQGFYWSSTQMSEKRPLFLSLSENYCYVTYGDNYWFYGFSVRGICD